MKKIAFLILVIALFSACTINKSYNAKQNFIQKIERWRNFELSGIIRITYNNLVFSKNIKIKKKRDSVYIDIFESGAFGMNPNILFHAEIDSLVHIKSVFPNKFEINTDIKKINNALKTLEDNSDVIIKTGKFVKNNLTVEFNQSFEISKVIYNSMTANLNYQNELSFVSILKDKKEIALIDVDKIKFFGVVND